MGRFSQIAKGTRSRKSVVLPLPGATIDPLTGQWTGPTDTLDVRALGDDEYADTLKLARAFAKQHGVDDPKPDDELYERGLMLHTLAIACVDKDSPEDTPRPYFDEGWEQIHRAPSLIPEIVGYLYLQQRLHQDVVNPLLQDMSPADFYAAALKTAGGDQSFFVGSRPGMQWIFTRTLAAQLVTSLQRNSLSSLSSEATSATNH